MQRRISINLIQKGSMLLSIAFTPTPTVLPQIFARQVRVRGMPCNGIEFVIPHDRANLPLLEVHHKNSNHNDNPPDRSNWELLCTYCHENEHSKLKDMEGRSGSGDVIATATFNPFAELKAILASKK